MKEYILKEMRKELERIKKWYERYQNDVKMVRELETSPDVIMYLRLIKKYNGQITETTFDIDEEIRKIYVENINQIHPESTNGIYICLGTYKWFRDSSYPYDYYHMLTDLDDKDACIRKYYDIEQAEVKEVSIDEYLEFEKRNYILNIGEEKGIYMHHKIQEEFFKLAITESQDVAVKSIIKKYGRSNSNE